MEKKKIYFGIETTTDQFMIAVSDDSCLIEKKHIEGRKHSEYLVPSIDEIFRSANISKEEITAIGVGVGPGSFTGIRVGMSVAITMAQLLDVPLYGISSMDINGMNNRAVALKAYRDKYYYAEYDESGARVVDFRLIDEQEKNKAGAVDVIIDPDEFLTVVSASFNNNIKGDWRNVQPIYIMDTVYKPKKRLK